MEKKETLFDKMCIIPRKDRDKEMAVVKLFEQARHDPVTRRFVDEWQAGGYASFENMLCCLVVYLSAERIKLMDRIMKFHCTTPPSPIVFTDNEKVVIYAGNKK